MEIAAELDEEAMTAPLLEYQEHFGGDALHWHHSLQNPCFMSNVAHVILSAATTLTVASQLNATDSQLELAASVPESVKPSLEAVDVRHAPPPMARPEDYYTSDQPSMTRLQALRWRTNELARVARNVERTSSTMEPLQVLLVLYSVVQRSITVTWPVIEERIVKRLRQAGMTVRIAIVTSDVGNHVIDGCRLSLDNISVVPYTNLTLLSDAVIDAEIAGICTTQLSACPMLTLQNLPLATRRNALRMQYSEAEVGRFMLRARDQGHVDVAIVMLGDALPVFNVSINDVLTAARSKLSVYTSHSNDAGAITNGFYIGHPEPLSKILLRNDHYLRHKLIVSPRRGYEAHLQAAFLQFGVTRLLGYRGMLFFKIRADGSAAEYALRTHRLAKPPLPPADLAAVVAEHSRITAVMQPDGQNASCMSGSPLQAGHIRGSQADGFHLQLRVTAAHHHRA